MAAIQRAMKTFPIHKGVSKAAVVPYFYMSCDKLILQLGLKENSVQQNKKDELLKEDR